MNCLRGRLLGGLKWILTQIGEPVERPPNEPSATASDDPSRIGPSGPGSHASLCSLPLIVEDLVPWENSIALAPGIAISALAKEGSIPSNQGSPTPMGSPSINSSTTDPMVSLSFLTNSISCDIDLAASASLQFSLPESEEGSRGVFLSKSKSGLDFTSPTL